jgi:hypothetical protein
VREYTNHARGFSLFVSARNGFFAASKDLAVRIGSELRATGKRSSVHHAERIEGEGRQIINAVNSVYQFDDLVVLRTAGMPAVLLEAGVIKHPDDELMVASAAFQADVAGAIGRALEQVCIDGLSGLPAMRGDGSPSRTTRCPAPIIARRSVNGETVRMRRPSMMVPTVRIPCSLRQHCPCGQSLHLPIGPEKPRNSAVFRGCLFTLDWRRRLGITL